MVRIVKISIGSNHNPEADLEAIVTSFWAHLVDNVQYIVCVGEDRTVVPFFTEDASLQLLDNVPESIAGVDNVESRNFIVQIVKISIGTKHKPKADIEAIIRTFWAHLTGPVKTVSVREDHTLVIFDTEDVLLQLLENVPESIAGVDNVKSEELTPEQVLTEINDDERLHYLLDIEIDQSDSDDISDSTEQSEEYDDDDDPTAKSDPVPKSNPAD